jgi:hypothetical protein
MIELIIRFLYIVIIFLFYLIGDTLTTVLNDALRISIDFKYILPIFSLAFFDYYLKKFSHLFYRLEIDSKIFKEKIFELTVNLIFSYSGLRDAVFKINSIENIVGIDPILIHKNYKTGIEQEYNIPERFSCVVNKNEPYCDLSIKCTFRRYPSAKINFLGYHIYFFLMRIKYSLDRANKVKRIYFIKSVKYN